MTLHRHHDTGPGVHTDGDRVLDVGDGTGTFALLAGADARAGCVEY